MQRKRIMDIEWWEVIVAVGVAAGLIWSKMRRPLELGLNKAPDNRFVTTNIDRDNLNLANDAIEVDLLREAHKHSFKNRLEIEKSTICGCFYCEKIFPSERINEWIDEGQTAMCPFCQIDSVLGAVSGFELSKEFLQAMNEHWF